MGKVYAIAKASYGMEDRTDIQHLPCVLTGLHGQPYVEDKPTQTTIDYDCELGE